jgi:hypothetical protein
VMYGGYSLRRLMERGPKLTPFQQTYFRAGHAHAGVLLVLSLVYYQYLDQTTISDGMKWLACAVLVVGLLAQSGGFFLHMGIGQAGQLSAGNYLTMAGRGHPGSGRSFPGVRAPQILEARDVARVNPGREEARTRRELAPF